MRWEMNYVCLIDSLWNMFNVLGDCASQWNKLCTHNTHNLQTYSIYSIIFISIHDTHVNSRRYSNKFHIFFYRWIATACFDRMLLGAWPIGGNKRPGLSSNATDRHGKCRFLLLCGGYGLFLIVGAAIFSVIEAPLLDRYERDLMDTKDKFLQSNPCINSKWINQFDMRQQTN